jgi:hypothetical protein
MQALIDQDLQDLLLPTYIAKRPTRAVPQSSKIIIIIIRIIKIKI